MKERSTCSLRTTGRLRILGSNQKQVFLVTKILEARGAIKQRTTEIGKGNVGLALGDSGATDVTSWGGISGPQWTRDN